jgi:hypothetical protein
MEKTGLSYYLEIALSIGSKRGPWRRATISMPEGLIEVVQWPP